MKGIVGLVGFFLVAAVLTSGSDCGNGNCADDPTVKTVLQDRSGCNWGADDPTVSAPPHDQSDCGAASIAK